MGVKIISSEEMDECTCGIVTDRKMIWVFEGEKIHDAIAFCHSCEGDLVRSLSKSTDVRV